VLFFYFVPDTTRDEIEYVTIPKLNKPYLTYDSKVYFESVSGMYKLLGNKWQNKVKIYYPRKPPQPNGKSEDFSWQHKISVSVRHV
jgi:hypothetical protein